MLDFGTWTRELAWWFGLTLGDGHSNNQNGRRQLIFTSGDRDLIEKWTSLLDSPLERIERREEHFRVQVGCKAATEWLASFGMDGKKGDSVRWPEELPEEFLADFVRGLWDSDGHIKRKDRTDGRTPHLTCFFLNRCTALVDGMVARVDCLRRESQKTYGGRYDGRVYAAAAVRGKAAVPFVRWLYEGAPAGLRSDRKCQAVMDYLAWFEANKGACAICGRPLIAKTVCRWCARETWKEGAVCLDCGNPDNRIYAKGRCRNCYARYSRRRRQAWKEDDGFVEKLEAFPVDAWASWSEKEQKESLREVLEGYVIKGLPWFVLQEHKEREDPLERVRRGRVVIEGDTIGRVGHAGQKICLEAHPHRLKASYRGHASAEKVFRDRKAMERVLRYQLDRGDPVTPRRVLSAVRALCRAPGNFPPVLARFLVDEYAPQGGFVFDPCCGYGGRFFGALASVRDLRYEGHDVEPRTIRGNERLERFVGREGKGWFRVQAVEDDVPWPRADLVLTCPPYFDRECYGAEAERVLRQYRRHYDRWRDGFLAVMIRKSLRAAPVLILCIAPTRSDSRLFDLTTDAIALAEDEGATLARRFRWGMPAFGKSKHYEDILVFK